MKYNDKKEKTLDAGKSKGAAVKAAEAMARNLPEFKAVQKWLDTEAEIKLKLAIEKIATDLKIPSLIIRSLSLKAISALTDLGLKLPRDAEIDLLLAYVSGDLLHVAIFEVKRSDTSPWQAKCVPPNKQAVKKAENQLTKDLDILMAILAGIPPSQIIFRTLAAYPDTPSSELCDNIICNGCLETGIICEEDIADSSLLQKKIQMPDKPDRATASGKKHLLVLSARCLSHTSLLHIGYREVKDKEKLVTARHRHNLDMVDRNMKEFVVTSPQQQKVISDFTQVSSSKTHLLLEGPAGTGKTLVTLQVAKILMDSITDTAEEGKWPVLVVTADRQSVDDPIMKYLDESLNCHKLFDGWWSPTGTTSWR